jgi:hypothetical protein
MQIQFNGDVPIVKSVKINDSFIVVSFCRHPEICVWNTKTRDLVYYLQYKINTSDQVWRKLFVISLDIRDRCGFLGHSRRRRKLRRLKNSSRMRTESMEKSSVIMLS